MIKINSDIVEIRNLRQIINYLDEFNNIAPIPDLSDLIRFE